ncbi:MAG: M28 family metallopeptidase [Pseudomonadota bacterium]
MNFKKLILVASGAMLVAACVSSTDNGETPSASKSTPLVYSGEAAAVRALPSPAARIKADVDFLADDARMGREAGTDGYLDAADYVAARMADIGLKPAGDNGGWLQDVALRSARPILEAASMTVTAKNGVKTSLTSLQDFRIFPSMSAKEFSVEGQAVFVGYGVHAPKFGHDDYAGVDLEGKVAVFFSGAPDVLGSEERAHFGRTTSKFAAAAERGAVAAILLSSAQSVQRFPWERVASNPRRASLGWVGPNGEPSPRSGLLAGSAFMNAASSEVLFDGAPRSFADVQKEMEAEGAAPAAFPLAVTVAMTGALEFEDTSSPNVIGMLEGSDPALKDEYLVLTAHLDHIGFNQKLIDEGKDGINNGAMDNALGIAVMLEVARLFADNNAPARSILVAAVTAEEKGLIGSDYLAHYPPVEKSAIIANINLDMPLMLHSFTDIVAFGGEHSSLGPLAKEAAALVGAKISPDPIPEQGIFTRSDHYRFVEQGIPSIFLWPGFENGGEEQFTEFFAKHYHRPSDEPSLPVKYDDVARFATVNAAIVEVVGNAPERPAWNEGNIFGELFAGE